jgi:hypothetical protein
LVAIPVSPAACCCCCCCCCRRSSHVRSHNRYSLCRLRLLPFWARVCLSPSPYYTVRCVGLSLTRAASPPIGADCGKPLSHQMFSFSLPTNGTSCARDA